MLFASVVVGWKTLVLGVRGEKVVRDWDLRRAYEESESGFHECIRIDGMWWSAVAP